MTSVWIPLRVETWICVNVTIETGKLPQSIIALLLLLLLLQLLPATVIVTL